MAEESITASGEVRLEARAQEPHAPPVEPPPVPVVVPDDQPNEPQEPEEPEPEEEDPEPLPPAAAPLDDEAPRALLNLLVDGVQNDRYPMSPRIRVLKNILVRFGEIGGLDPELAQKLHRYTSPPPEPRPPRRVYAPPSRGKYKQR